MPIGAQHAGIATGPNIGPRMVDPQAELQSQGVAGPVGVGFFPIRGQWLIDQLVSGGYGFVQVHVGPCTLYGWNLVAKPIEGHPWVVIIDGRSLDDPIVAAVGFEQSMIFDKGIAIQNGLYVAWHDDENPPTGALYYQ